MSGKRSRTSGDTKLQLDQKDVLLLGLHQKGQCSSHVEVTRILLRASPEGIDHTTSASIQLPEIRECGTAGCVSTHRIIITNKPRLTSEHVALGFISGTSGRGTPPQKMSGSADS
ncbi:hypothetical protein GQR58_023373 [Nymphon striatum]|nr:hypothetical protein GQR58_023373 [Nymphon striatum]